MTTPIEKRIEEARARAAEAMKKVKQLEVQQEAAKARKLAVALRGQRADETRKKILLGAFVLDLFNQRGLEARNFALAERRFADWLTRPDDRALFQIASETNPGEHGLTPANGAQQQEPVDSSFSTTQQRPSFETSSFGL